MKNNFLIYLTAFCCGMTVMAIEISATRLLAPYFGTSMVMWTIIISLILVTLSIGNILGGKAADKYNNYDRLYKLIFIATLWIAAIPLVGKFLILLVMAFLMLVLPNQLLVAGSGLACLVIFSFPLIILGMVAPYLVKLGIKDMEHNGKTTGEIYAFSTIGSILGTFIPTFLTIPTIGTSRTFFVFALLLIMLCLYYYLQVHPVVRKQVTKLMIAIFVIALLLVAPFQYTFAFWTPTVIERESPYNYLQINQNNNVTYFSTSVAYTVQSMYIKDQVLTNWFFDSFLAGPLFLSNLNRREKVDILVLGLGAGTFAKQCKYFFPQSHIEGVEIDPEVVNIAKTYFDLREEEVKIYIEDGRTFLQNKATKKYDLIFVDAYRDITVPFHMATREFFAQVKKHLKPQGVIMTNINLRVEKNNDLLNYLAQTMKSLMKKVYRHDISGQTNSLLLASDNEKCLTDFRKNVRLSNHREIQRLFAPMVANFTEISEQKLILTDEVAPVEIMGQKAFNEEVAERIKEIKRSLQRVKNLHDLLNLFL